MTAPIPAPSSRRLARLAALLTAVVLAALFVLLIRLSLAEDYWLDEAYSVRRIQASWRQLYNPFAVQVPQPANPFDLRDVYDLNPPLYFALVRLVAGPDPARLAVRLVSAVPMLLALLFLLRAVRRAHGPGAQLLLLALAATAPATIYYGHEARPYALPLLVACALLWALPRLSARPGRLFVAALLAAALGALMHFAFAWFIIALFVVFAAQWLAARRDLDAPARRAALAGAAGLALGSLLALVLTIPELQLFARCKSASTQALTSEVMMNTLGLPFSRVGSRPTPPPLAFAVQFALLLMVARRLPRSPRRREGLAALALWLIPLALPALMKMLLGLAFYERYAFFCLPGWLLTLAWLFGECGMRNAEYGFDDVNPQSKGEDPVGLRDRNPQYLAGVLLFFMLALNVTWCARNLTRPIRVPVWRPLIARFNAQVRPGDAYAIDPALMNVTFAVNAAAPPPADWFSLAQGLPNRAASIWIFNWTQTNPNPRYALDPARWRLEKVAENPDLMLFHATPRPNP